MQTLYLVLLDRHHLGDSLFLKSLAQEFADGTPGEPPCVLVHGSGEKVERTLEAKGHFPDRTEGVLEVEGQEQRRLVERAVRETNQDVVAALTDEVVSAVGIQGVDRGLFTWDEVGGVSASNVGWLAALIKQRVVPVVSALVEERRTGPAEVWAAEAMIALARALESSFDPVACVLTKTDGRGLTNESGYVAEAGLAAVTEDEVPDPQAVERLHEAGLPVFITNVGSLLSDGTPEGTRIRASE